MNIKAGFTYNIILYYKNEYTYIDIIDYGYARNKTDRFFRAMSNIQITI